METIDVEIEINASDQMEKGGLTAFAKGIYHQLSALEMLVRLKIWLMT